uniref:Cysteine protease n=1 Tax=Phallusia mammillata TaxID=59560 RepID=A0A6F9D7L6_9ASCI|nr:cysteine protease ATG4A [Phallusia mammillata]
MAFAFGYFNVANQLLEGDPNIRKSQERLNGENASAQVDVWNEKIEIHVSGRTFSLPSDKQHFLKFVKSKLWFTYRKGFSAIGGTGPTSDTGWGCMLRCGQMMLAQTLSLLSFQDEWMWSENSEEHPIAYKRVLNQFKDVRTSCYSIHQIAQMGVAEGKEVGQWFGPNTVAQVIKRLSRFDEDTIFSVHVAMDNTVCIDEIEQLCSVGSQSPKKCQNEAGSSSVQENAFPVNGETQNESGLLTEIFWKPLLLIIPLRLGLSDINPVYFQHLKECLQWEESVGIVGGKPNHAYYFFGFAEDSLIYLDPHTTQPFVDISNMESTVLNDDTYHCATPGKMLLTQLDPSLALGFVCKTRDSFEQLCQRAKSFQKSPSALPLFEVVTSLPPCGIIESRVLSVKSYSREKRKNEGVSSQLDDATCLALDSDDSLGSDEEFEILDIY